MVTANTDWLSIFASICMFEGVCFPACCLLSLGVYVCPGRLLFSEPLL